MKNRKQIGMMLALSLAAAGAQAASLTIPAGATVSVRMTDAIDTKKNRTGETFRATVDSPVMVDGKIVVPKGAEAIGRVTEVQSPGRLRGRPFIAVELTALNFEGKSVSVRTSGYQEGGRSRWKQTAIFIGGGTLVGTVVGALGGAPWLGVRVGAAAGAVANTVRGPGQISIAAETLLVFTLQSPLPLETEIPAAGLEK